MATPGRGGLLPTQVPTCPSGGSRLHAARRGSGSTLTGLERVHTGGYGCESAHEVGPGRLPGSAAPPRLSPCSPGGQTQLQSWEQKKNNSRKKKIHIRHPSPLHAHTAPKPRSPARPSSHPSSLYSYRAKHWSHGSSAAGPGKASRSRRTRLSALGLPASAFSPLSPPAPGHEPGRAPVSSTRVQPPRPPSRGGCGETPASNMRSALLAAGGEVREGKVWSARGAGGERKSTEPGRREGKRGE